MVLTCILQFAQVDVAIPALVLRRVEMVLTCILQFAQVDVAIPALVPRRVEMGLLGAWSQRAGAPDNFYRAAATLGLQAAGRGLPTRQLSGGQNP
jgi:hypothetical protein